MAKNLMFSKSYYLLAPDIQTRIRLTRLKCVLIKLWWAISSCCRQLHVYECKMCERTSWPQSETGHFTCVVLHMFSALLPRRSVDLNENQTENSSEIGNSIKSTEGEKVTSLSPFDICRYFHIKLYTAIICNYFLDSMYLLYVAIICIVPALVLPVADVSSIVPKHCITRVHDHCVQGVPALILEEKQINNQSIHKQKMQYSRKKEFRRTCAKFSANTSWRLWEKSKVSGKGTLQSSLCVEPRLFRNRFRFMHKIRGSERSLTPWTKQMSECEFMIMLANMFHPPTLVHSSHSAL